MFSHLRRRATTASLPDPAVQQKLDAARGRAPIQPAPIVGKYARAVIRPLMADRGVSLSDLQRTWPEIVGEKLARATAPEKLANATLTIRAAGAIAPFVQHQQALILDRCRLAGAKVERLQILQAPLPRPEAGAKKPAVRALSPAEEAAVAAQLEALPQGRLREALLRLGKAVAAGG